jgi:hypothetical protein
MMDVLWPLRGLMRFLASPSWWLRPLVSMAFAGGSLCAIGLAVLWWRWPDATVAGWHAWLADALAIGQAAAAILAAWLVLTPLVMGLAMESLVRSVHRRAGVQEVAAARAWPAALASMRVLLGTLAPRLGWGLGGIALSLCAGPAGAIIAALGMAYVACLDAIDLALTVRGLDGGQRLQALRTHRGELMVGALLAGGLNLLLAATVIGWVLWLPGLAVGAASLVLGWQECDNVNARDGVTGPVETR